MRSVHHESGAIKHRLTDPAVVLAALNLSQRMQRSARGYLVLCPWHEERTPSCSVTTGPDGTLRAHCFGCGQSGDVISLAAAALHLDLRADFPRVLAELSARCGLSPDSPLRLPPLPPLPRARLLYPPDAARVWDRCPRLTPDDPLWAELAARAIDPAAVRDADLARVLPASALPPWCRAWARTGHRLILPLWDARGNLASLHGRTVAAEHPNGQRKGRFATGYTSNGLLMADATACDVLATGTAPWWNGEVLICEGATDFLSLSARWGDSAEQLPATLAIYSGAWNASIAARIPSRAAVRILPHSDPAGRRYVAGIAPTLGHCRAVVITEPFTREEGRHE